jgi:hypothetical protein
VPPTHLTHSPSQRSHATAIIRVHFSWGDDLRVETIDIEEPEKDFVRNHVQGTPFPGIVRFNIYPRGAMGVWQGRADLQSGEVISETFRADARAMVAVEEVLLIEKTVKADPRFQEALRRRGLLAEVDNMCIDPWTVGRVESYYLWNVIGFPFETTITATRLIVSGLFERHPTLNVVLAPCGGYFPYQLGRLDHGYRMRPAVFNGLPKPPSFYLRNV